MQKLAVNFVKSIRYVLYEIAFYQLRLFSLFQRRIRGHLMSMFRIIHGLLEFPMESIFIHPTRTGLRVHAHKFFQQRCFTSRRQHAFSVRFAPFRDKLPAEVLNTLSVNSFKMILDANWRFLFPEVPSHPHLPTVSSLSTLHSETHTHMTLFTYYSTRSFIVVLTAH